MHQVHTAADSILHRNAVCLSACTHVHRFLVNHSSVTTVTYTLGDQNILKCSLPDAPTFLTFFAVSSSFGKEILTAFTVCIKEILAYSFVLLVTDHTVNRRLSALLTGIIVARSFLVGPPIFVTVVLRIVRVKLEIFDLTGGEVDFLLVFNDLVGAEIGQLLVFQRHGTQRLG